MPRRKDPDETRACTKCGWVGNPPILLREMSPAKSVYDCPRCGAIANRIAPPPADTATPGEDKSDE